MSDSCHEYFILCQPVRECALYRRHVFHAPEWLADEELKEGTILVKDQYKETYALTDRKEIQIGSDVEGLDDKLVQLSNTDAEQLLQITSLEKRYRLFMRLKEQRQKERKELDFGAQRAREITTTGGSDGRTTPKPRRSRPSSDSEWHFNQSQEDEKQQEWRLQRQKLEDKLKEREDYIDQLNTMLSEKGTCLKDLEQKQRNWEDERDNLLKTLNDLERKLEQERKAKEKAEKQLFNQEKELKAKEEEMNELKNTLSTSLQTREECRPKQPCDWVISRDEIQMTDDFLGEGAWGKVVLGRFRGCKVAVKQIHDLVLCPRTRCLFERELNIASRCRHPCLLQFIGATNDEESPLFVTELMETSLRALVEQPLSTTDVSIISLDVAQALNYLHKTNPHPIIHRDISSSNVLLWRQGDQWRGKVSDYGTANFMQQTMTVAPGAMVYSAPEALTTKQTTKLDVYSFGVLLCEMCLGKSPAPEHREEQISQVKNAEFKILILRCVQSSPEMRPDMQEIIVELEAFCEDQSKKRGDELSTQEGELKEPFRDAEEGTTNQEQSREISLDADEACTGRQQSSDWVISRDQILLTDTLLGNGDWASVVEGKFCDCIVAVKQIHELILSPYNRSLFEREIDIASRCRHPCLLQFIGATSDEGSLLLVTELMESSLQSFLLEHSLSETEMSIISQDVTGALTYLHKKKPCPIIHRNISSANVLLWRQGNQWRGKLTVSIATDFQQPIMTIAPGEMPYSAPETQTTTQTVKVDIYSFGVLLCEMCLQERPDPEKREQQVAMVKNRVIQAIIWRCLQKDPEERPWIQDIVEELA